MKEDRKGRGREGEGVEGGRKEEMDSKRANENRSTKLMASLERNPCYK